MLLNIVILVGLVAAAYTLGSIPSAVWIGKRFYNTDVREHGSNNAGATNVLRVLGRRAGLSVFLIDGLKGYAAVMLSWVATLPPLGLEPFGEYFVNFRILLIMAVIAGHIFPVFAGFRGGKGVATMAGCLIAFAPVPTILSLLTFLAVLMWKHYVSLGSISAAALFPIYMILSPAVSKAFRLNELAFINDVISPTMVIFGFIVAGAIIFTHRKNIQRLREGTESKTHIFKRNNQE